MSKHEATVTGFDLDDVIFTISECPRDSTCQAWTECPETHDSATEGDENDGELVAHGDYHMLIDGMWMRTPDDYRCGSKEVFDWTPLEEAARQHGLGTYTLDVEFDEDWIVHSVAAKEQGKAELAEGVER